MAQQTLDNKTTTSKVPFSRITGNCLIIYNHLLDVGRGLTLKQLQTNLQYTEIRTFDNRLRELKKAGWVTTRKPLYQDQLYFAVRKSEARASEIAKEALP